MRCDGVRHGLCFYMPKARRTARSSSNVKLGGRTIFFFRRLSKAFLAPYFSPVLKAADAMALPAIKIRGMMPPPWRRRRRRPMLVMGSWRSLFIGSHEGTIERFTPVLFALATLHLGSPFSANLFGFFLLTLPEGFGGRMCRLENTRDESRRDAASLRSSTASGASLASRHLDSGRLNTSPCFLNSLGGGQTRGGAIDFGFSSILVDRGDGIGVRDAGNAVLWSACDDVAWNLSDSNR